MLPLLKGMYTVSFINDIKADIQSIKERDPAAHSALEIVITYSGVHAVIMHRVAHWFYEKDMMWENLAGKK